MASIRHLSGLCFFLLPVVLSTTSRAAEPPVTVYWEGDHLAAVKSRGDAQTEAANRALARLQENAEAALRRGPYSVMQKKDLPPSGDKHDYLSYSRYWWPNPDTEDGLPYVRRDGDTNRQMRARGDRDAVGQMIDDVETLSLAYYFFGDDRYAEHAAQQVRTWFLDSATRMNPNLNYGQGVLGRSEGRSVGIIDTRGFILVLDGLCLVRETDYWSEADDAQLREWFAEFLTWLRTSELGREEAARGNNHGSWYAAQAARIALFVKQPEVAREIVEQVRDERIDAQFESDGSQPEELERTRSMHYSFFNLAALAAVARVGDQVDIDLWHYQAPDGGGIRSGLEFLAPYVLNQASWPHPQMGRYDLSPRIVQVLRMASTRYDDPQYVKIIQKLRRRNSERDYAVLQFAAE